MCELLFACARLTDDLAQGRVNRAAGRRLLRPSYTRLLPFLTTDGIRVVDLARRVDVSKQAVSKALSELEAEGFVAVTADPDDGRAKRVRLTPVGVEATRHGISVLAGIDAELAVRLGRRRVRELQSALTDVLAHVQDGLAKAPPFDERGSARSGHGGEDEKRGREER
ncbi:MAG: MarR family transcriptional regulator [Vicinamibacterales bacterium]